MTSAAGKFKTETALQRERRVFREELERLRNCALNSAFDLTAAGARRRSVALTTLFLLLGALISLRAHPLAEWAEQFSRLFQFLFNPTYATVAPQTPADVLAFVLGTFFGPGTLRFLPVFVLPFLIALQAAAGYLSDVFELPRVAVAREFILQVAFSGNQRSIRIGSGEVAPESLVSPIYLIGGPGKAVVELDTVAVFEKPDGTPHIIGPTVKGGVLLEGFERYRQALDLRDQYTDPLEASGRSRDGIPVSARDVRMVFSIWREGQGPTAEIPHPFSKRAVEALVYRQTCNVIADGPHPSECNPSQPATIQSLIRTELTGFMSRHPLAEYLANIGAPEIEQAREREAAIAKAGQEIVAADETVQPREVAGAPPFQPRRAVSSLFSQFTRDFTARASDNGVELKWIGIGIWKTPSAIIPEKHLEAWRLSRENMARGSTGALNGVRAESRLGHIQRLIQNVPLARFRENRSAGREHSYILRDLLVAYREQLIESLKLLNVRDQAVDEQLAQAVERIEAALQIKHWVGRPAADQGMAPRRSPAAPLPTRAIPGLTAADAPIPPADPEEAHLYQILLEKVDRDWNLAEELIENERKRAPTAERKAWLEQAIAHWPADDQ